MTADDEHPASSEVQTRAGEIGHLDGASNAPSQPCGQLFNLITWDFNEVLGLAGKDLVVFSDLVDQMGARGGRPAAPGDASNRCRDKHGKNEGRESPVMSHCCHERLS
jgi:hypothetical protein